VLTVERAAELQLQFALFPAKWISREEMTALAVLLRTTVLAPRFRATAAA